MRTVRLVLAALAVALWLGPARATAPITQCPFAPLAHPDLKPIFGELPLPHAYDRENGTRGRVIWKTADGRTFDAFVDKTPDRSVEDFLKDTKFTNNQRIKEYLEARKFKGKIRTVRTLVEESRGDKLEEVGKFEVHLLIPDSGKPILVIDKAFADLQVRSPAPLTTASGAKENLGTFGTLQAIKALLGKESPREIGSVEVWEVVNFDTLLKLHEDELNHRDLSGGAALNTLPAYDANARQAAYQGSKMDRYVQRVLAQLQLSATAAPALSGGEYQPFSTYLPDYSRSHSKGSSDPFVFDIGYVLKVPYDPSTDAGKRKYRNSRELEDYRQRVGTTPARRRYVEAPDKNQVFGRFHVTYPVQPAGN